MTLGESGTYSLCLQVAGSTLSPSGFAVLKAHLIQVNFHLYKVQTLFRSRLGATLVVFKTPVLTALVSVS